MMAHMRVGKGFASLHALGVKGFKGSRVGMLHKWKQATTCEGKLCAQFYHLSPSFAGS